MSLGSIMREGGGDCSEASTIATGAHRRQLATPLLRVLWTPGGYGSMNGRIGSYRGVAGDGARHGRRRGPLAGRAGPLERRRAEGLVGCPRPGLHPRVAARATRLERRLLP